jgi:nicotinate phosphoribosyltransferase
MYSRAYPIYESLLRQDLYKFNMGRVILEEYNDYWTKWKFQCRNPEIRFTEQMVDDIYTQVECFCELGFYPEELEYLQEACPWLSFGYLDYLSYWYPRFSDIRIEHTEEGCGLEIEAEGTWLSTSMYEVPILAIVSEVYFTHRYDMGDLLVTHKENIDRYADIIQKHGDLRISEFGLRRRLSGEAQEYTVKKLRDTCPKFLGTSDVYLAKDFGVRPMGTQAHEFIQCVGQGNPELNPAYSNKFAMKAWTDTYGTDNGIALTDTIGSECFWRDFSETYANLFHGLRQDSGDPFEWGERAIARYKELGVDPKTKTLIFSDSLDIATAIELHSKFSQHTNVSFGIGTTLSNAANTEKLNIIMKVVECNGRPVAKISDSPGKAICTDPEYLSYLQRAIDWRLNNE